MREDRGGGGQQWQGRSQADNHSFAVPGANGWECAGALHRAQLHPGALLHPTMCMAVRPHLGAVLRQVGGQVVGCHIKQLVGSELLQGKAVQHHGHGLPRGGGQGRGKGRREEGNRCWLHGIG